MKSTRPTTAGPLTTTRFFSSLCEYSPQSIRDTMPAVMLMPSPPMGYPTTSTDCCMRGVAPIASATAPSQNASLSTVTIAKSA